MVRRHAHLNRERKEKGFTIVRPQHPANLREAAFRKEDQSRLDAGEMEKGKRGATLKGKRKTPDET